MEIMWRDDEYLFEPLELKGGGDKETKNSNIDGLIFGSDTESVQLTDRYEPQCFTLSDPFGVDSLEYIPENANALQTFLEYFSQHYFETCVEHGKHHFIYYHNLTYDWLQLVKTNQRLLEMAKVGVSPSTDTKLFTIDGVHFTLKKNSLFTGSAPHVRIQVQKGKKDKNSQSFMIYIYDTFSFFPSSLSKLAKDLKLDVEKMDRQEDLGDVDYRDMPPCEEKEYFEKYAKIDARVTRLAAEKIRELHKVSGMYKIRASAPGYAIQLLFHMMDETHSIVTGDPNEFIMQLIFDTYRGGRTGGIYHGEAKNLSVLDFHSSYPASMLSLPSFSKEMVYIRLESEEELSLENVLALLEDIGNAFLEISGTETDSLYPSLLTSYNGKLTPVYGDFQKIRTTGYEFYVGMKSGGLQNITIHECVLLLDLEEEPFLPFKVFAESAYERKNNSQKGSVEYASAKLALNAAYGKLIESRMQTLLGTQLANAGLLYISGMEKEFGNYYYGEYVQAMEKYGEDFDSKKFLDYIDNEVHHNFGSEIVENMVWKLFSDFSISGRVYGRNVIPAAASLITGCSRARLLVAMKALGAIYWDTDSVFVEGLSGDILEVNEKLWKVRDWLPQNAVPVMVGEALGELDFEMVNGNGYLAGVKRYYLEEFIGVNEDGHDIWNIKSATHGIPALSWELKKEVISSLSSGHDYSYTSKPKPIKAKEAKSPEEIGSFRPMNFKSEFHLDERLQWEKTADGWLGVVKPFVEMGVKELAPDEYNQYLNRLYKEELKADWIKAEIEKEGYLQTVTKGSVFYFEYKELSKSVKLKYFRKLGVPVDVWCTNTGHDVHQLFEELRMK